MQCISLRFFAAFLVNQRGAKKTISTVSNLLESSSPYVFISLDCWVTGSRDGSLGHWVMGHVCNGSDGSWVTNK